MDNINFKLPKMYEKFLEEIKGSEGFPVGDTGVILYEEEDLPERNLTYEVFEYEPDFFMIGQDGDLAFFIKRTLTIPYIEMIWVHSDHLKWKRYLLTYMNL